MYSAIVNTIPVYWRAFNSLALGKNNVEGQEGETILYGKDLYDVQFE